MDSVIGWDSRLRSTIAPGWVRPQAVLSEGTMLLAGLCVEVRQDFTLCCDQPVPQAVLFCWVRSLARFLGCVRSLVVPESWMRLETASKSGWAAVQAPWSGDVTGYTEPHGSEVGVGSITGWALMQDGAVGKAPELGGTIGGTPRLLGVTAQSPWLCGARGYV